jgi:K+-sensing histidine kinase KdpD
LAAVGLMGLTTAVFLLAGFLTFNYFIIEPYRTFIVHQPSDVVMLLVSLIVAAVLSQLLGSAQRGLAAFRADHVRLAITAGEPLDLTHPAGGDPRLARRP